MLYSMLYLHIVAGCELDSQFLPKACGLLVPDPSNPLMLAGVKVMIVP